MISRASIYLSMEKQSYQTYFGWVRQIKTYDRSIEWESPLYIVEETLGKSCTYNEPMPNFEYPQEHHILLWQWQRATLYNTVSMPTCQTEHRKPSARENSKKFRRNSSTKERKKPVKTMSPTDITGIVEIVTIPPQKRRTTPSRVSPSSSRGRPQTVVYSWHTSSLIIM